jgi:hypothetical protein
MTLAALGVNVAGRAEQSPSKIAELGATWARCVAYPDANISDWIRGGHAKGIKVLLVLASESIGQDANLWSQNIAMFRDRYPGLVDAWQLGNEADHVSPSSWTMTQAELSLLLIVGRNILGPDAYLVGAGMADGQPDWADSVDWSPVNALGVHPYAKDADTSRPGEPIDVLFDGYARQGKPLWVTEYHARTRGMAAALRQDRRITAAMAFCMTDRMVKGFGIEEDPEAKADFKAAAALVEPPVDVPTVPEPKFVVGAGILKRMAQMPDGDGPASDEIYIRNRHGQVAWSEAMGTSGRIYRWSPATKSVSYYDATSIITEEELNKPTPPIPPPSPPPQQGGPWEFWSPVTIAGICATPVRNVEQNWPLIYSALVEHGIADRLVQEAAIGTVAIETASTFEPVREAFWLDNAEAWRKANLRYYPYYGRGFIQLTWNGPTIFNYQVFGDKLGVDLVSDPDRALEPEISARVLALFFKDRGVADAALAEDWPAVRRRVQGGSDKLDRLVAIVGELERAAKPIDEPPHVIHGRAILQAVAGEASKRYAGPVIGEPDSFRWGTPGWDCSSLVSAAVERASGGRVKLTAFTDAMYPQTLALDPADSVPGDIVFYEYRDPAQPGVRFPHVGLLSSATTMFDAQFGKGVGNHPILARPYVLRRAPLE